MIVSNDVPRGEIKTTLSLVSSVTACKEVEHGYTKSNTNQLDLVTSRV